MSGARKHTPGDWTAARMVHAETGEPLTPAEIGECVTNSVIKSEKESGTFDFLFVSVEKADGPADICLVGNGPTSPENARLIEAVPKLLEACALLTKEVRAYFPDECDDPDMLGYALRKGVAALAKARGES